MGVLRLSAYKFPKAQFLRGLSSVHILLLRKKLEESLAS